MREFGFDVGVDQALDQGLPLVQRRIFRALVIGLAAEACPAVWLAVWPMSARVQVGSMSFTSIWTWLPESCFS